MKTIKALYFPLLAMTGIMIGCGQTSDGGNTNSPTTPSNTPPPLLAGQLIDSVVSGVTYKTDSQEGITRADGSFDYLEGETVAFSIGGIQLGQSPGKAIISPLDLAETLEIMDSKVVNRLRLLQTLDDDNDPDNGIHINESIQTQAAELSMNFDQSAMDFQSATSGMIAILTPLRISSPQQTDLISTSQAVKHFLSVLQTQQIETTLHTPTDIQFTPNDLSRYQSAPSLAGTFETIDSDFNDVHTYSLVSGEGDTDNRYFQISGNTLKTAIPFNDHTKGNYQIRVRTTDISGAHYEKELNIVPYDAVNENTPTDLLLNESSLIENQSEGTQAGTFETIDPNFGDSHEYSLVSGTGDTDNASFQIAGNVLQTATSLDYEEKSVYQIRVRTTDSENNYYEKSFSINLSNQVDWNSHSPWSTDETFFDVLYEGNTFKAVGSRGLIESDEGSSWPTVGFNKASLSLIAYGNGIYVAIGKDGTLYTLSSFGILIPGPQYSIFFNDITFGNSLFVAIGPTMDVPAGPHNPEDYNRLLVSSDGQNWTTIPSPHPLLYGMVYGNNLFVGVGSEGITYRSTDGNTWNSGSSGSLQALRGITYGNGLFVAVGDEGTILTSPDGITWTAQSSGTSQTLRDVSYGANTFVIVGNQIILSSQDGVNWTNELSDTPTLYGVAHGENTVIVVGDNGTVLQKQ